MRQRLSESSVEELCSESRCDIEQQPKELLLNLLYTYKLSEIKSDIN